MLWYTDTYSASWRKSLGKGGRLDGALTAYIPFVQKILILSSSLFLIISLTQLLRITSSFWSRKTRLPSDIKESHIPSGKAHSQYSVSDQVRTITRSSRSNQQVIISTLSHPITYLLSKPRASERIFPIMQFFYQLLTLSTISFVAIALPTPPIIIHEQVLNSRALEPENKVPRTIILKDLVPRNWIDDIVKIVTPTEPFVLPFISSLVR